MPRDGGQMLNRNSHEADVNGHDPAETLTMRAGNGKGKVRLYTRQELDGRTRARRQFDAIAEGIAAELPPDQLSTVRKHLIEAFAGVAVVMNDLNARLLAGEAIDLAEQAQTATTLTRLATRIGIERRPRDVTPDPLEYARQIDEAAE
jgi:hypothetical protein